jgi:hypothetical protein
MLLIFRRAILFQELSLTRSVSIGTIDRKLAFPFLKLVHPDFFSGESEEVRNVNLVCIQNINEIWDSIECIDNDIKEKSGNVIYLVAPFRNEYQMMCYVRNQENSRDVQLRLVDFKLMVPDALCRKQQLLKTVAATEVQLILVQLGQLFQRAGLTDPWLHMSARKGRASRQHVGASAGTSSSSRGDSTVDDVLFGRYKSDIDYALFERMLQRSAHQNGAAEAITLLFTKMSGSRSFQENRKTDKLRVNEIDNYLRNGNLMMLGVPLGSELNVLKRFRLFLLEYGLLVNFSVDTWKDIHFILVQQPPHLSSKTAHVVAAALHPPKEETIKEKQQPSYAFTSEPPVYMLQIPANFKVKQLLEFLRVNIPACSSFN